MHLWCPLFPAWISLLESVTEPNFPLSYIWCPFLTPRLLDRVLSIQFLETIPTMSLECEGFPPTLGASILLQVQCWLPAPFSPLEFCLLPGTCSVFDFVFRLKVWNRFSLRISHVLDYDPALCLPISPDVPELNSAIIPVPVVPLPANRPHLVMPAPQWSFENHYCEMASPGPPAAARGDLKQWPRTN